jgi:hypothetical protein
MFTAKEERASSPAPTTFMLTNLTSPGARGAFDTVAQEEAPNKTIPLNKMISNVGVYGDSLS